MYKCKHFEVYELVDPMTYTERGDKSWHLLDPKMLKLIDVLRDWLGPATINNWYWDGHRENSGLRTPQSPYYRKYSQHSFGRAFDMLFKNYTAEEVRAIIEDRIDELLALTGLDSITVENGVAWLHIDNRNNNAGFNSFNP